MKKNGDNERKKVKMLLVVGMIKVCGKDKRKIHGN
jgi:hypothetical protein